jgi:hypothetical protein
MAVSGRELPADSAPSDAVAGYVALEPRRGLFGDVADEIRWMFTGRKGWLFGVITNLAIASAFAVMQNYDPHAVDDIRVNGLAVAIVTFSLAGVISTNQLGSDADRVRNSLERGDTVLRILLMKGAALMTIMLPVGVGIAAGLRASQGKYVAAGHAVIAITGVIVFWVGVGGLASVLAPYRPLKLRLRLQLLRERRDVVHWGLCMLLPYGIWLILWPGILWQLDWVSSRYILARHLLFGRGQGALYVYSLLMLMIGIAYGVGALLLAQLYANKYPTHLENDLRRES